MHGNVLTQSLRHVWTTLETLQAPTALMGGIALAAWERVRATQDIDLLIEVEGRNTDELIKGLESAGLRPKRQPPMLTLGTVRMIQFRYQPPRAFIDMQVDLLLAESEYHRQALARRVQMRLPDLEFDLFVLTCEDLILHKLLAGRIIDRADCIALLAANRPALDHEYLARWSKSLGVETGWQDAWRSAIAGDTPPG